MNERIVLWMLRVAVAALPLTVGAALSDWLSTAVKYDIPVVIAGWLVWAALLMTTIVPNPLSRTVAHILGLVVAVSALLIPQARTTPLDTLNAFITYALVLLPPANAWWINGTAYPNERRYMLRIPSLITLGPLALSYVVTIGVPAAALFALAEGKFFWFAAVLLVGTPMFLICVRAIHQLGRRWIVFVPAGVVLHDPMSLTDPVLFQRGVIEKLSPAPVDTDALDLTQSALGMSIELDLTEKVSMVLAKPLGKTESGSSARLMFTPARPGEVLAEAARRKLPR